MIEYGGHAILFTYFVPRKALDESEARITAVLLNGFRYLSEFFGLIM